MIIKNFAKNCVLQGIRLGRIPSKNLPLKFHLKEQFQDWEIVNLTYPLRTSKTLSEMVKNDDIYYTLHRNTFNSSLDLPPNMPNGPKPLLLPRFTTIFTL